MAVTRGGRRAKGDGVMSWIQPHPGATGVPRGHFPDRSLESAPRQVHFLPHPTYVASAQNPISAREELREELARARLGCPHATQVEIPQHIPPVAYVASAQSPISAREELREEELARARLGSPHATQVERPQQVLP